MARARLHKPGTSVCCWKRSFEHTVCVSDTKKKPNNLKTKRELGLSAATRQRGKENPKGESDGGLLRVSLHCCQRRKPCGFCSGLITGQWAETGGAVNSLTASRLKTLHLLGGRVLRTSWLLPAGSTEESGTLEQRSVASLCCHRQSVTETLSVQLLHSPTPNTCWLQRHHLISLC